MEKKQAEILAPAGSWASMKAAVAAGADAVYMGGTRFGARAYADNPDEKGLLEAIDYVHLHGRRLYMTVNTLFKESELKELAEYMAPYYNQGLDGVIVQDLGALRIMKENFPGLELHASTQMTITSVYGARMLKDFGCSRVVTSREMSLDEIRRVREEVDVEIESFVHGALCYCYSGQCLMSSLIGGRSGNRGRCAQPCRLPYRVYEGQRGQGRPAVMNRENEKYVLSLKDLCTLDILPDILEAGVYSLKIEGRMKSPRYTAGVVSIYRKYVDRYLTHGREGYHVAPEDRKMLLDLFDRGGFTSGYYEEHNGRDMVALKEKPEFREGNQKLFDYLDRAYVEAELKESVMGHVILETGKPSVMTLSCSGVEVTVNGQAPEAAQKQPMTEEKVLKQLNKTGNTPFSFEHLGAELKGEMFLPVQALNELRRQGMELLEQSVLEPYRRKAGVSGSEEDKARDRAQDTTDDTTEDTAQDARLPGQGRELRIHVSLEEPEVLPTAIAHPDVDEIYLDAAGFGAETWAEAVKQCHAAGKRCALLLPHIFRKEAEQYLTEHSEELKEAGFDEMVLRSMEEVGFLREAGLAKAPQVFDSNLYTMNHLAANEMRLLGASRLTLPLEENSRELEELLAGTDAFFSEGSCREREPGSRMDWELLAYGYLPAMVSAQCIVRTTKGCTRRPEVLRMRDRTGKELPVKNHCRFCYNTVYNPSPLSLLGQERIVERLKPSVLRLAFTIESPQQTREILDAFADHFRYGKDTPAPFEDFTRGHLKRGVE